MTKLYLLLTPILLCGCTYNISMAHTEGVASDVIDDTQSQQGSLDFKLPLKAKKEIKGLPVANKTNGF